MQSIKSYDRKWVLATCDAFSLDRIRLASCRDKREKYAQVLIHSSSVLSISLCLFDHLSWETSSEWRERVHLAGQPMKRKSYSSSLFALRRSTTVFTILRVPQLTMCGITPSRNITWFPQKVTICNFLMNTKVSSVQGKLRHHSCLPASLGGIEEIHERHPASEASKIPKYSRHCLPSSGDSGKR